MIASPLSRSTADVAVDLGTSTTRIIVRGRGVVVEEPTVVAVRGSGRAGRQLAAVGQEAKRMLGRTPEGTDVLRPVRAAVIADFDATEMLLKELLARAGLRSLLRPRVLVCIPLDTTEVERRAVQESARAAGGREVLLVSQAACAALGAELPIAQPVGNLVVDLGGGRTEAAVVSLGGLVVHRSARVGGEDVDEAIRTWLRRQHDILVGERTAEEIKLAVGAADRTAPTRDMTVRGRDQAKGVPREVQVSSAQMPVALHGVLESLVKVVLDVLADTPPELSADIVDRGIVLAGGTALLPGFDRMLRDAVGLPVVTAEDPTRAVARGASQLLEDQNLFGRLAVTP